MFRPSLYSWEYVEYHTRFRVLQEAASSFNVVAPCRNLSSFHQRLEPACLPVLARRQLLRPFTADRSSLQPRPHRYVLLPCLKRESSFSYWATPLTGTGIATPAVLQRPTGTRTGEAPKRQALAPNASTQAPAAPESQAATLPLCSSPPPCSHASFNTLHIIEPPKLWSWPL